MLASSPKRYIYIFALALAALLGGCSADIAVPQDTGTLGETVADETQSDDTIAPASNDAVQPELDISAGSVFCCNPLSIEFAPEFADDQTERSASNHKWDFGDGRTASEKTPTHTFALAGTYHVTLEVTLSAGTKLTSTSTLTLGREGILDNHQDDADDWVDTDDTISPAIINLTDLNADAGPNQIAIIGDIVLLSATATHAIDQLTFHWQQLSGPAVTLANQNATRATFTAPDTADIARDLVFEITITAGDLAATDTLSVTVSPADKVVVVRNDPTLPTEAEIVTSLAALAPLQKPHFSFPLPIGFLDDPNDPLLKELIRVTHGASVRGENIKEAQLRTAMTVCRNVNRTSPDIPAAIAVNYSPWHRVFPVSAPPTDVGLDHDGEVAFFKERMTFIRDTVATLNRSLGADVPVATILLDSERFYIKDATDPGATEWNNAITHKHKVIYDVAKDIFPGATISWYGRGIQESDSANGWSPFPWFNFDETGDTFACSLYRVAEIGTMRETFRRTHDLATSEGNPTVIPWVALGAGYRRDSADFQNWFQDWDYDTVYSNLLGRELNNWWYSQTPERFAPYDAADFVVFYPSPFDPETPAWGKHFVAYVRGSNELNDQP